MLTRNLAGNEAGAASKATMSGRFPTLTDRKTAGGNYNYRRSYSVFPTIPPVAPPPLSQLSDAGLHVPPPTEITLRARAYETMEVRARMQAAVASHLSWIVAAMVELLRQGEPSMEDLSALLMAADRACSDNTHLAWHACSTLLLARRDHYLDRQKVAADKDLRSARAAPLGAPTLFDDQIKGLIQYASSRSMASLAVSVADKQSRAPSGFSQPKAKAAPTQPQAKARRGRKSRK